MKYMTGKVPSEVKFNLSSLSKEIYILRVDDDQINKIIRIVPVQLPDRYSFDVICEKNE